MNVYALQTARAGSKSVPNKNIMNIRGKSLYLHNIHFAQKSKHIKDVFISTDYDIIKQDKDIHGHLYHQQKLFYLYEQPCLTQTLFLLVFLQ